MARAHSQDALRWMLATTMQQQVAMMVLAPSPVAPTRQLSTTTAQLVVMTALAHSMALKVAPMLQLVTTTHQQQSTTTLVCIQAALI